MLKAVIGVAALAMLSTPAQAQDARIGARLFLQCRACHMIQKGGGHGVGPNLFGLVGARAAASPGYNYSPALAKSGIVWNVKTLDAWLMRPSAVVPGTRMLFAGMPSPAARANVIAYLATLKDSK